MGSRSETRRLFFALWPDEVSRARMVAAAQALRLPAEVRTRPENLHITLAFLGEVERAAYACLLADLRATVAEGFTLVLDAQQYWARRRLLWLKPRAAPPALIALVGELRAQARRCGLRSEEGPYHPHVTLARRLEKRPAGAVPAPIFWAVRDFVLVQSMSTQAGSEYQVLHRWPLMAAA